MITFSTDPFTARRGDSIKSNGTTSRGRLVHANKHTGLVIVAYPGTTENPGSRYSGLRTYYPACTAAYMRADLDRFGRQQFTVLGQWDTRASK